MFVGGVPVRAISARSCLTFDSMASSARTISLFDLVLLLAMVWNALSIS